ncbi:MAG: hypothetical protein CEN87_704 [Parcubacteria group bacterium Licking1014_1]|nr:MAG: hypothetical protein CEN87_704 [Parcubacteria group bacterium Licking1014_1]
MKTPETGSQEPEENLIDINFDELLDNLDETVSLKEEDIYKLENIRSQHEEELKSVGIDVKLIRDEHRLVAPEFDIDDSDKFLNYLGQISEVGPSQSQARFLHEVIISLEYQLSQHYDTKNPNDKYMINLLGNLDRIMDVLPKLHLENQGKEYDLSYTIQRLQVLNEARKLKYIDSYQEVIKLGLLKRYNSPSEWYSALLHGKISVKEYQANWNHALSIVEKLKENPEADEFRRKLIHLLTDSINYAIQELIKDESSDKNVDDGIRVALEQKIKEVSNRLQELK